jgi:hypothetical protein
MQIKSRDWIIWNNWKDQGKTGKYFTMEIENIWRLDRYYSGNMLRRLARYYDDED